MNKYNSKGVPLTDLGAELDPCVVCGVSSVLMFSWCKKCREYDPIGFSEYNPMTEAEYLGEL